MRALVSPSLLDIVESRAAAHPGHRLHGLAGLSRLLVSSGPIGRLTVPCMGQSSTPVAALLFDKSEAGNRALGWHKDRTIVLRDRRPIAGFGPWTVKQGLLHVAPPIGVLERMLTIRVHLDPVPHDNAPLLVAPGSH